MDACPPPTGRLPGVQANRSTGPFFATDLAPLTQRPLGCDDFR
jgi:hypothetical protein